MGGNTPSLPSAIPAKPVMIGLITPATTNYIRIQSYERSLAGTSKNFVIEAASSTATTNGSAVDMNYWVAGSAKQLWTLTSSGQLKNKNSNLCLTASYPTGTSTCAKSTTLQNCVTGQANQIWSYDIVSGALSSKGVCLHIGGGSTVAGSTIWTCLCSGVTTQSFSLIVSS